MPFFSGNHLEAQFAPRLDTATAALVVSPRDCQSWSEASAKSAFCTRQWSVSCGLWLVIIGGCRKNLGRRLRLQGLFAPTSGHCHLSISQVPIAGNSAVWHRSCIQLQRGSDGQDMEYLLMHSCTRCWTVFPGQVVHPGGHQLQHVPIVIVPAKT
jgi:hypothetical protein